ncbi:hypothetical protein PRIPAC_84708 [Pristionchus pacificus]|uniref:SOSS complex subunit A homolog n=1 Tax=Pristionchus pacificus TaxID=54126 RepID=A0A8R1UBU0_PRIPA|nr:hypothetical protein PRIPAC_84708 [Pristionchus pacificus]
MSDPRTVRKGGQNGSRLLKSRDKYNSEATLFEKHWENHFTHFIRGPQTTMSESQFRDRLISSVNAQDTRERVTQGLLYGLLSEPENTNKYFSYLGEIATDNWYSTLCNMNMILFEYFTKITDQAKNQIVQFFRLAIRANVGKIDNVIMNFVRYGSDGSDFTSRVRLIKAVVEMLSEKEGKDWILSLKGLSLLMPTLLNIVIRLAVDLPQGAASESTRSLFLSFAFFIVARRLQCCLHMGRDLLLILMRVSKTTQFASLWRDLIKNPGQFGGAFKNVEDLLNRPPHNSIFPLKLSIPMQRQLEFLLIHLKHGNHEKHLEWFTEWHCRRSDSSSLRAEIIRFVLSSTHNKDFNPEMRAAVAYSMLTACNPGVEMQWSKLVMWWDWFGFTMTENPVGVENTLFVLRYAIGTQPVIGQTLLEFAMKEIPKMHPPMTPSIRASFNNVLRVITERHGQQLVSYVLDNSRFDMNIRELCKMELSGRTNNVTDRRGVAGTGVKVGGTKIGGTSQGTPNIPDKPKNVRNVSAGSGSASVPSVTSVSSPSSPSSSPSNSSTSVTTSTSSTPSIPSTVPQRGLKRDADKMEKNGEKKEGKKGDEKGQEIEKEVQEKKEIDEAIKGLKGELKNIAIEVHTLFKDDKSDEEEKCGAVQKVMEFVQDNDELHEDESQLESLGHLLGCLLRPLISIETTNFLPDTKPVHKLDNESLAECFNAPIHVVFRSLSLAESRSAIESIISWMREKDSSVTYLLLFFLKVYSEDSNLPVASYENVATHFESTLDSRLSEDLDLMARDDRRLFTLCLPFVFKSFSIVASGCIGLFRTFCHFADNDILCQFLGAVYREDIVLFRKDSFNSIVQDSLEWEGVAEMMLWQLIHADGVNAEWFYPLYTKINSINNSVASAQLLILLKRHEPNTTLVRAVMSRPLNNDDHFTTSAIKLMIEDEECCTKTADILSSIIKKQMASGEILVSSVNSKNTKTKNSSNKLSMEHIFFHLTELSTRCLVKEKRMTEQLLTTPSFRETIHSTKKSEKSSILFNKYEKLFSFVDMLDEQRNSSRSLRGNRSGSARGTKREATPIEDDSKKKKKPSVYIVDSDSE